MSGMVDRELGVHLPPTQIMDTTPVGLMGTRGWGGRTGGTTLFSRASDTESLRGEAIVFPPVAAVSALAVAFRVGGVVVGGGGGVLQGVGEGGEGGVDADGLEEERYGGAFAVGGGLGQVLDNGLEDVEVLGEGCVEVDLAGMVLVRAGCCDAPFTPCPFPIARCMGEEGVELSGVEAF